MADAIVFDLWQTLVPLPDEVKEAAFVRAAEVLDCDTYWLRPIWARTRRRRETSELAGFLRWLRADTGRAWTDQQLAAVVAERRRIHGQGFAEPTEGADATLAELGRRHIPVAVCSNCSSDVRDLFTDSPLGRHHPTLVLSAECGIMKPDPAIYRLAARALDRSTDACLFVGDGHDGELEGARTAGMKALLFDPHEPSRRTSNRIGRLEQVLDLI